MRVDLQIYVHVKANGTVDVAFNSISLDAAQAMLRLYADDMREAASADEWPQFPDEGEP